MDGEVTPQGTGLAVAPKLCLVCKTPLADALYPEFTHPGCSATAFFDEPNGEDPFTMGLKRRLMEVILWAADNNPRNHQVAIGPSEIGNLCDRAIAYRLTRTPRINTAFDPWPSIMGTAIHAWLEKAFIARNEATGTMEWVTEATLDIEDFIEGHSDLYEVYQDGTVIDWKTAGVDAMRKYRANEIPPHYRVQAHTYGYGFARLGVPVKKVALVFLPRAGWLRDMHVWAEDYDPSVAEGALDRVFQIAQKAVDLDVTNPSHAHRFEQIFAHPGNDCGFCPWLNAVRTAEDGASDLGCPGN